MLRISILATRNLGRGFFRPCSFRSIPTLRLTSTNGHRTYASFSKVDDASLSEDQVERINKIASTLRANPEIKTLLEEFQVLLEQKGFKTDKAPSMFQMIKLLAEKDISSHLQKLKVALDNANISFGPEDIQSFMNFYSSQKNKL